jgi:hypothetical protein
MKAPEGRHPALPEAAVLVNACRDEWMGELQQDGATPAEQYEPLRIDAPSDAAATGQIGPDAGCCVYTSGRHMNSL